jgi:hypothetical protein
VVKENKHLAARWCFQTARGKVQHRRDLFAGQVDHSMISSTLAPASRFSKTVATGIRVPRKTHAPLTFPGMLSSEPRFLPLYFPLWRPAGFVDSMVFR